MTDDWDLVAPPSSGSLDKARRFGAKCLAAPQCGSRMFRSGFMGSGYGSARFGVQVEKESEFFTGGCRAFKHKFRVFQRADPKYQQVAIQNVRRIQVRGR